MNTVLLLAAIIAVTASSTLLALSQPRHWQTVTGLASPPPRTAQRYGWALLGTSMVLVILRDGASFGALSWPMIAGLGAVITAGTLTWMPSWTEPLARWCDR